MDKVISRMGIVKPVIVTAAGVSTLGGILSGIPAGEEVPRM
jgi:hypothetical protein